MITSLQMMPPSWRASWISSCELVQIEDWAITWLVTFNLVKTTYMFFSNKLIPTVVQPFFFCGEYLEQSFSHVHLGMTFTPTLYWNGHLGFSFRRFSDQRLG
jgi:hypothetical protein